MVGNFVPKSSNYKFNWISSTFSANVQLFQRGVSGERPTEAIWNVRNLTWRASNRFYIALASYCNHYLVLLGL